MHILRASGPRCKVQHSVEISHTGFGRMSARAELYSTVNYVSHKKTNAKTKDEAVFFLIVVSGASFQTAAQFAIRSGLPTVRPRTVPPDARAGDVRRGATKVIARPYPFPVPASAIKRMPYTTQTPHRCASWNLQRAWSTAVCARLQ